MATPDPSPRPSPPTERGTRRPAVLAAAILGAVVAVFAVLNSQSVEVNWIGTTTRTPLIVVIVLFLLIGFAAGVVRGHGRPRGRRGKR